MSDVKVEYVFSKRQRRWGTFAAVCIAASLVGLGLGGAWLLSLSSDASHRSRVNKEDLCKLKYAQLVIDREARREKASKGPTFDAHFVKVLDALTPVVLSIKSSERCVPKGPGGSSSTVLRAEARRVAQGPRTRAATVTSADHTPGTSTPEPAPRSGPTASTGPTPGPPGPTGKQGPPGSTPAPAPAPVPTPTVPQPPPPLLPLPPLPCVRLPLNPLNCP